MNSLVSPLRWVPLLALLVSCVVLGAAAGADAQPTTSGPTVTMADTELAPDERVVLTIDGFQAASVTITVCGNEARRGSADCNMVAGRGLRLDDDGTPTVVQVPIEVPPVGCPCVVRVSSRLNDEIAVAPFTLVGHPVEPLTDGPATSDPLVVSIVARPAPLGALERARTSLGGPARYEVTVTVRNRSTAPYSHVSLAGAAVRSNDLLATLALDDPGVIGAGQTWKQVVSAEVPGPSLGEIEWRVTASGAGPAVTASDVTRQRPLLLIVLVGLLIIDLFVLAVRFLLRRHVRRERLGVARRGRGPLNSWNGRLG
ncbi:MAG: hypothetical protein Q7V88_06195 [Actinomycetota bacterium]|nr:hypothetical protein [Actinomycetota bacterium]